MAIGQDSWLMHLGKIVAGVATILTIVLGYVHILVRIETTEKDLRKKIEDESGKLFIEAQRLERTRLIPMETDIESVNTKLDDIQTYTQGFNDKIREHENKLFDVSVEIASLNARLHPVSRTKAPQSKAKALPRDSSNWRDRMHKDICLQQKFEEIQYINRLLHPMTTDN